MNKKLVALLSLTILLALPVVGLAQTVDFSPPEPTTVSLIEIVLVILNVVWIAFVAIAIVMFIIAGIMFMTAMGEPEKVGTARNFVIWGAVGIIIAVLAWSIVSILRTEFDI